MPRGPPRAPPTGGRGLALPGQDKDVPWGGRTSVPREPLSGPRACRLLEVARFVHNNAELEEGKGRGDRAPAGSWRPERDRTALQAAAAAALARTVPIASYDQPRSARRFRRRNSKMDWQRFTAQRTAGFRVRSKECARRAGGRHAGRDRRWAKPRRLSDVGTQGTGRRGSEALAAEGYRVLAFAERRPKRRGPISLTSSLNSLADFSVDLPPLRRRARRHRTVFASSRIRVIMVTGDQPGDGCAIRRQVGLADEPKATWADLPRTGRRGRGRTAHDGLRTVNVLLPALAGEKL